MLLRRFTSQQSSSLATVRCTLTVKKTLHRDVQLPHMGALRFFSTSSSDPAPAAAAATPASNVVQGVKKRPSMAKILADLSKARLSALVVLTSGAGFFCAGAPVLWDTMALTCTGTALCAASAATFNQVLEVDRDAAMNRTKTRPLPAGHISKGAATAWGVATAAAGTALLSMYSGNTAAMLGLGNILLYAGPYTLSKPHHEINTWIGSVVGAVPPVMGWVAATAGGTVASASAAAALSSGTAVAPYATTAAAATASSALIPCLAPYTAAIAAAPLTSPVLLASILFLWQFPHFFALSWMHREDYSRGGFAMVACADASGARSAALIRNYAILLAAVPLVSTSLGMTSTMFAVEGTLLNAYFLYLIHKFSKQQSNANARRIFLTSLWYLPLLLAGYVFYNKNWDKPKDEIEEELVALTADGGTAPAPLTIDSNTRLTEMVAEKMDSARAALRGVCLHEIIATDKHPSEASSGGAGNTNPSPSTEEPTEANSNSISSSTNASTPDRTILGMDASTFCPVHLMPGRDKEKDKDKTK